MHQNIISNFDEYLFHEGKHYHAYKFMGAHSATVDGISGVRFTTWAPNASQIILLGDFNHWQVTQQYALSKVNHNGLWSIFVPHLTHGMKYKFAITNAYGDNTVYKADPYAFSAELRPNTASVINLELDYKWHDEKWLELRSQRDHTRSPINIYEVHLASWCKHNGEFMTFDEISEVLPLYVQQMHFTHVEFMPLSEHPLDASWGYQITGYYAVTSRHGDLRGLKKLIDRLHNLGIGVILDWVPGHFCKDEHGLINFDGSATYEYPFYWKANNKGWGTHNFDLGRHEVQSFLISNAMYWLEEFHFDGLRVDAVSNILYLDYDRSHGEWHHNYFGNNHNLEGIAFLKQLNFAIKQHYSGVLMIAEESSAWAQMTTPVENGGMGFDFKWNMGWMNDSLRYIEMDPIYRRYHHNLINFAMVYNYSENFILPISHDEVVHGKKALVDKMAGDLWNKYAGLRLFMTFMLTHPGKKLLFMGSEFAQFVEWRESEQLQWQIIDEYLIHKQIKNCIKELNFIYQQHSPLWEADHLLQGFRWIDADNSQQSIVSFVRYNQDMSEFLVIICNFTNVVYYDYQIGVPEAGEYIELFNSDDLAYGGSGQIMSTTISSIEQPFKDYTNSVRIKIPPMAAIILQRISITQ